MDYWTRDFIIETINEGYVENTLDAYKGIVVKAIKYIAEIGHNPWIFPWPNDAILFFVCARVNTWSISVLERTISAIEWFHNILGYHPSFKNYPQFKFIKKLLNKRFKPEDEGKMPFKLKHYTLYLYDSNKQ